MVGHDFSRGRLRAEGHKEVVLDLEGKDRVFDPPSYIVDRCLKITQVRSILTTSCLWLTNPTKRREPIAMAFEDKVTA